MNQPTIFPETDPARAKDGRDAIVAYGSSSCGLWWSRTPELPGERVGLIGHFEAYSKSEAEAILHAACTHLRERSCTIAIGPMNGSTWKSYRFVTRTSSEPPFFLEPSNPPEWPDYWLGAGFEAQARYTSTLVENIRTLDPRLPRIQTRLRDAGVKIRHIEVGQLRSELELIHQLSLTAFSNNHLYTPLPLADFLRQYEAIQNHLVPGLIEMAFSSDRLIGFLFAIPNLAEAQRGETVRTIIGKSLAILPGRAWAGLGILLTNRLHEKAASLGFQRVIHALEKADGKSGNMSARLGELIREYTLFRHKLA